MAQLENDAQEPEDTSIQDKSGLTRKLINWVKEDMHHVSKWRKRAREEFEFYAGDQWTDEDKRELELKNRPALTFNRIAPLVNAVTGSEINNRREIRYIPREEGDAQANEVLSAAAEWFRDECDAEDEESDAFQDMVIGGMGWIDTRLDFEEEPDGAPKIERMDPFEMGWDALSSKPGLAAARRMWRVREMGHEEAEELTGVKDPNLLNASWIKGLDEDEDEPHDQTAANFYEGGQNNVDGYQPKKVTIVEIRWLENEEYVRGPDVQDPNQIREYNSQQVDLAQQHFNEMGIPAKFAVPQAAKKGFHRQGSIEGHR